MKTETIAGANSLVLFKKAQPGGLSPQGALNNTNVHIGLGNVDQMTFFAAVGMGDVLTAGVRFEASPLVTIDQAIDHLVAEWGTRPKFAGRSKKDSRYLINRGLVAKLRELQSAYEEICRHIRRTNEMGSWFFLSELFIVGGGDVMALFEYGQANEPEIGAAFLGQFDRCLSHTVGWRPLIPGFSMNGDDGPSEVLVFAEAGDAALHDGHLQALEDSMLPPPTFRGHHFEVRSFPVAA
jgi:hypothetical protein